MDYANLSDVEFEELCRDVLSVMLQLPLRSFARGRDRGVDLTDDVVGLRNVVQVKHYVNSTMDALVNGLKRELPKVEKLKPQQYYICCSRELPCERIKELYGHFVDYMDSPANIVTGKEITDFLKDPANKHILRKHYKLWIDASGILEDIRSRDCFVDCEVLLSGIERDFRRFVRTQSFDRALECLQRHNVLCIVGSPGVGKTMTSKMLVMHYAARGYRVRYSTDVSNLTRLKDALSENKTQKEVILLDDCFGQAYFEMKSGQSKELLSLMQYIKENPAKVLILNSRFTIYQEAKRQEYELKMGQDNDLYREYVLNIGQMRPEEKAKMFYNHLYFHQVPDDHLQALRRDRGYAAIVEHPNFNPRIIEYVCLPHSIRSTDPEAYPAMILRHLDNPTLMWQNEYEYKLRPVDRILLQTVYSLTNHFSRKELVEKCFHHRIAEMPGVDTTLGTFDASLDRLLEGMVRKVTVRGEVMLGMVNPSINDFLDGYLEANPAVKQEMVNSICNMWQITRLIPSQDVPEYCVNLIRSGKIHDLIYRIPENKPAFVSYFLLSQHIMEESCRQDLWEFLDHPIPLYFYIYLPSRMLTNAILEYMNQKLWDFYGLSRYFAQRNKVYRLLKIYDFSGAVGCIKLLSPFFRDERWDNFAQQAMRCLKEKIDSFWDDMQGRMITKSVIDIEQVLERVISHETDGPKLNVEYLESILHAKVAHKLIAALKELGEPFDTLAEYVQQNTIHISNPEKFAAEYLAAAESISEPVDHRAVVPDNAPAQMQDYQPTMDEIFNR